MIICSFKFLLVPRLLCSMTYLIYLTWMAHRTLKIEMSRSQHLIPPFSLLHHSSSSGKIALSQNQRYLSCYLLLTLSPNTHSNLPQIGIDSVSKICLAIIVDTPHASNPSHHHLLFDPCLISKLAFLFQLLPHFNPLFM